MEANNALSIFFVMCGVLFLAPSGQAGDFTNPRILIIIQMFLSAVVRLAFLIVGSNVARLIPADTALEAGNAGG